MITFLAQLLFLIPLIQISHAQEPPAPIADLRLLPPSSSECNALEDEPSAITLRVWSNFTRQCYNLNQLFDPDERGSTCTDEICRGIMPLQLSNWDPSSNYSRVYFDAYQPGTPFEPEAYDPSSVVVRAFTGRDCDERDDVPWFQWGNCNETDTGSDCEQVDYNLVSVLVMPSSEVEGLEGCQIAALSGDAGFGRGIGIGGVVVAVFAFGLVNFG